jgi:hypothetical protein
VRRGIDVTDSLKAVPRIAEHVINALDSTHSAIALTYGEIFRSAGKSRVSRLCAYKSRAMIRTDVEVLISAVPASSA